jgi:hypothetical protein
MARRPWTGNIRYHEFTPSTIGYDIDLDAFYVARADLRSLDHPHRLTIAIAVTARYLTANRLSLPEAITMAQRRLDHLIAQHHDLVEPLPAHETRVFDLAGRRLR